MTETQAVNLMLMSAGLTPVNSLDIAGIVDVEKAKDILLNTSREIQKNGWHFNTERNYKLLTDPNKHISLPTNCLQIDSIRDSAGIDVTIRGTQLRKVERVDGEDPTEFDEPVHVDMVVFLPFEELPEAARWYVAVKAARRFAVSATASATLYQFSKEDEMEAKMDMEEADSFTGDYSILRTNDVLNTLRREYGG